MRGSQALRLAVALAVLLLPAISLRSVATAASAGAVVIPSEAWVPPGGTLQFTVDLGPEGEAGLLGPSSWRVVPATVGTIDGGGLFTAGNAPGRGLVRVEARSERGLLVGHALVWVGRRGGPPRLRVVPESASLLPGEEVQFRAEPPEGAAGTPVAWSVVPPEAGSIDAAGRFRAGATPARARVVAALEAEGERLEGAARVRIARPGGPPPDIRVVPEAAVVRPGETARFDARFLPPQADSIRAGLSWSLFPETLGRIAPDGAFDAGPEAGEGRVVASVDWNGNTLRAFGRVKVLPPRGTLLLRVDPPSALLSPGRAVQFRARLLREAADRAAEPPAVTWSVEPPEVGSIGPDGLLTAFDAAAYGGVPLRGHVIARATAAGQSVEGRAAVRVAPVASADLDLRPRFLTITPGGEVLVRLFLAGKPIPQEIPVRWEVHPATLGTVTPEGLFTANANLALVASDEFGRRVGVLVAAATLPEGKVVRGTARVVVVPPAAETQIVVLPQDAVVAVGNDVKFRIAPLGGNLPPMMAADGGPRVTWIVRPEGLGPIAPDGTFTASPSTRLQVAAAFEGLQEIQGKVFAEVRISPAQTARGEARVTVRLPSTGGLALAIEPPEATVPAGTSLRFAGRLRGRALEELPLGLDRRWSVAPFNLGVIGPDGLFVPNPRPPLGGGVREGAVRLTVTSGTGTTLTATARVVVTY